MVLVSQVTSMIDFMEANPELARGHLTRTGEGKEKSKRLWAKLANSLNSLDAAGPSKSGSEWRTFYNDFKHKVVIKLKKYKKFLTGTGGGPGKFSQLTSAQERLADIIGRDIGEPLPDVRHNPLKNKLPPSRQPSPPSTNAAASTYLLDTQNTLTLGSECELVWEEDTQLSPERPERDRSPIRIPTWETIARDISPPMLIPTSQASKTHSKKKKDKDQDTTQLEISEEKLAKIEANNAAAILIQAEAINRLAAAIEKLADKIPKNIFRSRRDHTLLSSDSE